MDRISPKQNDTIPFKMGGTTLKPDLMVRVFGSKRAPYEAWEEMRASAHVCQRLRFG